MNYSYSVYKFGKSKINSIWLVSRITSETLNMEGEPSGWQFITFSDHFAS